MTNDDTFKQGSGDTLGEFDLGPFGTLTVSDDGCNDWDTRIELTLDNGDGTEETVYRSLTAPASRHRQHLGDADFMAMLSDEDASGGDDQIPTDTRGPVAWVCQRCKQTWPRSAEQHEDEETGETICPDCADP